MARETSRCACLSTGRQSTGAPPSESVSCSAVIPEHERVLTFGVNLLRLALFALGLSRRVGQPRLQDVGLHGRNDKRPCPDGRFSRGGGDVRIERARERVVETLLHGTRAGVCQVRFTGRKTRVQPTLMSELASA